MSQQHCISEINSIHTHNKPCRSCNNSHSQTFDNHYNDNDDQSHDTRLSSNNDRSICNKCNYTIDRCQCNRCADIHPVCPLKMIKYVVVAPSQSQSNEILALYGSPQEIRFQNIGFLIGRAISLTIPKFISSDSCDRYEVTISDEVVVEDINNNKMNVIVTLSSDNSKYYVTIPITDDTFFECDLVFYFVNLTLNLTKLNLCECECVDRPEPCEPWLWIPSVVGFN
jgi:hypothetical protein